MVWFAHRRSIPAVLAGPSRIVGPNAGGLPLTPAGTRQRQSKEERNGVPASRKRARANRARPRKPDRLRGDQLHRALVIIVLAIIGFLVWALTQFFG